MSTIAAGTTSGTALVSTGNTDGTIQLQVNGTTPSVTLATTGAIGVGSTPGYGTSGQVLVSGGSAAAPSWATPSSGAMVYISQVVASSASTVDIENAFTDYETYVIIGSSITTTSDFYMRVKIGGSYITSGTYYYWGLGGYTGLATPSIQRADDATEIIGYGFGFSTVANFYLTISVKSGKKSFIKYEINGDTTSSAAYFAGAGANSSTGALQGIRIFGSTYTGTFRLYGIVKS
jgi:hypothetical protein